MTSSPRGRRLARWGLYDEAATTGGLRGFAVKRVGATLGILVLVTLAACSKSEVASKPSSTEAASASSLPPAPPPAAPTEPGVFVASDDAILGITKVSTGTFELTLKNEGTRPHELQLITFIDRHTGDDLVKAIAADPAAPLPSWAQPIGGTGPVLPGESEVAQVPLMATGYYAVASLLPGPDGVSDAAAGLVLPITAESTRSALPGEPDHSWTAFQMPSHNVGCIFSNNELRCDILSGMRPEPKETCALDWTGLGIEATGRPGPVCAGDTAYDRHAKVLFYGANWGRGGITCYSRQSGLECTNTSGHGFTLAQEQWTVT